LIAVDYFAKYMNGTVLYNVVVSDCLKCILKSGGHGLSKAITLRRRKAHREVISMSPKARAGAPLGYR